MPGRVRCASRNGARRLTATASSKPSSETSSKLSLSTGDAGRGDEHVDRAQARLDRGEQLGRCLGAAQIRTHRDRVSAAGDELVGELLGGLAWAP